MMGLGGIVGFLECKEHSFSLHSIYQAKQANVESHSRKK